LLAVAGRKGCANICLAVKSPKGEDWKVVSDVFYELKAQDPMPWATYSKLTRYLVDAGFLEKSKQMVGRRKLNAIRLTRSGEELVKFYVGAFGKRLDDLKPEQ
jgi:hypothetical protein